MNFRRGRRAGARRCSCRSMAGTSTAIRPGGGDRHEERIAWLRPSRRNAPGHSRVVNRPSGSLRGRPRPASLAGFRAATPTCPVASPPAPARRRPAGSQPARPRREQWRGEAGSPADLLPVPVAKSSTYGSRTSEPASAWRPTATARVRTSCRTAAVSAATTAAMGAEHRSACPIAFATSLRPGEHRRAMVSHVLTTGPGASWIPSSATIPDHPPSQGRSAPSAAPIPQPRNVFGSRTRSPRAAKPPLTAPTGRPWSRCGRDQPLRASVRRVHEA